MIKTNKKTCINISTDTYSGKEQSPKGFGYSADGFELNYEKTGQDNRIWIVQIKNNRKVWIRKNNNISNITHEEPIITSNDNNNTNDTNDNNDTNDTNDTNDNNDNNDTNDDDVKEIKETKETKNSKNSKDSKDTKDSKEIKEKKTDYNIFLKYYLELIKIINETKPKNERKTNKELFNETVNEWKNIKKLITDKKNNNKDIINDYISKWNDIKIIPTELIEILQK